MIPQPPFTPPFNPSPVPLTPFIINQLSDADIEKVAHRVVKILIESLRGEGFMGFHHSPIEELDDELHFE